MHKIWRIRRYRGKLRKNSSQRVKIAPKELRGGAVFAAQDMQAISMPPIQGVIFMARLSVTQNATLQIFK